MKPEEYWHQAGEAGYDNTYYVSHDVGEHLSRRLRALAVDIAGQIGIRADARVLDLGCGDGSFANTVLARTYQYVHGCDLSEGGIRRAQESAELSNVQFEVCDLRNLKFRDDERYGGAFLMGILHHVKQATPEIVRKLREVTDKVVVLEPNGNHLLRKALELTPSYRAAGEDSFKTAELEAIFKDAGFRRPVWQRVNLFPNFTPRWVFRALRFAEPACESSSILRALCTVNMWGFAA